MVRMGRLSWFRDEKRGDGFPKDQGCMSGTVIFYFVGSLLQDLTGHFVLGMVTRVWWSRSRRQNAEGGSCEFMFDASRQPWHDSQTEEWSNVGAGPRFACTGRRSHAATRMQVDM